MEVILLQRVEKLGQMGDIVSVKPGHARNHLIPKGFADRATKDRIAHFESMKKQFEADNLKKRDEAQKIASKMTDVVLEFIRPAGDTGNLYGSIRRKDIAVAVTEAGFSITKNQVQISEPVKTIGLHTIAIQLHPEVSTPVILNIAMTDEEAKMQLKGETPADEEAEAPKKTTKKASAKKTEEEAPVAEEAPEEEAAE